MLTSTVFAIGAAALLGQAQVVVGQADIKAVFRAAVANENWATADITNDPFYETPSNFSTETSKPGDLLRWQDLTYAQLATNFTRVPRGMSLSRFTYVTEDKDRKPIPSSGYFFASQGFAVIATDYAGLGAAIPTTFQYEASSSVPALRTNGWSPGHSEGGMTAWRTNERLVRDGQEELLKAGNNRYIPWIKALFDGNVPAQGCKKPVLANFISNYRRD
ncbi:hypothetical protein PpBr36_04750 [Pyricularia pennisetigena]|uniref:hypothetical protein n=1 Tax=Pyricularia pennisetigena TaxID=1578925 RepID=UPI00115207DF|nr:hypothetical protein PpBr36_04750 [Pyricularia pennisetigena]TLS26499.1 hypothetical protein PpBr36_04750 [Pyricularia pennisetigena]